MAFLAAIKSRRAPTSDANTKNTVSPTPLIHDTQGLYAKVVWKQVLEAEVDAHGHRVWLDAATHLSQLRDASLPSRSSSSPSSTSTTPSTTIDFKCGTGSRGVDGTRVSPCSKQFQRMFGNKRRQYHWLDMLRPRVIPETHFSLQSAARHRGTDQTVWFAKEVGMQRGTGIRVMTGMELVQDAAAAAAAASNKTASGSSNNGTVVFQRAIADGRVLLYKGRKADLRLYLLVEPSTRQEVFLYNDAVVRVAPGQYGGNNDTTLETQLTNVATGGTIVAGKEWLPFSTHLGAIQTLMRDVVIKLRPWFERNKCELLGVDVMIDEDGRPWLVELNGSPSMGGHDTPYLFRPLMLKEMLHVAVYPELKRQYERESRETGGEEKEEEEQEEQERLKLVVDMMQRDQGKKNGWVSLCVLGESSEEVVDGCSAPKEMLDVSDAVSKDVGQVRFAWLKDEQWHHCDSAAASEVLGTSRGGYSSTTSYHKSMGVVGLLSHPEILGQREQVVMWRSAERDEKDERVNVRWTSQVECLGRMPTMIDLLRRVEEWMVEHEH